MYDIDNLFIASTVAEAINALSDDENAVIISGGSDVLIKIREGKLAGCRLISIHDIEELKGVKMLPDGTIKIGPAECFSHITKNEIIQKYVPVLGNAVDQVGGPQIRNIGTLGGNVCNGVTSADSACTLMVLQAQLELTGKNGSRTVPITQFYTGPGKTVRTHDEIMTAIYINKDSYEGFSAHYVKYAQRNAMDIATLGCAVNVRLSADKKIIEEARLAFGVAAPTPIRCAKAESELKGKAVSKQLINSIGSIAVTEVNPRTSWRASREFRLGLVHELSQRVLAQAIINGGGDVNA